jgi:hypothetical protein
LNTVEVNSSSWSDANTHFASGHLNPLDILKRVPVSTTYLFKEKINKFSPPTINRTNNRKYT